MVFSLFDILGIMLFFSPSLANEFTNNSSLIQIIGGGIFLTSFIIANYLSYQSLLEKVEKHSPFVIRLFGQPIGDGFPETVHWCLIHPGTHDELAFFPLSFEIVNKGNSTLDDVVVAITVPSICLPDLPYESDLKPKIYEKHLTYSIDKHGEMTRATYLLLSLDPQTKAEITQSFAFEPTLNRQGTARNIETELGTIDIHYRYSLEIPISLTVQARDTVAIAVNMRVECIVASTTREGIDNYVKALKELQSQYLSVASFSKRIAFFFSKYQKVAINFPSLSKEYEMEIDGRRFYWLKNPEQAPSIQRVAIWVNRLLIRRGVR